MRTAIVVIFLVLVAGRLHTHSEEERVLLERIPSPAEWGGNQVPWETRNIAAMDFVYRTYHRHELCGSDATMYVIESTPLNRCYPPDPMSKLPHKFVCSKPGSIDNYQYAIHRAEYAKTDTTCSQSTVDPIAGELVKKDNLCKKDIDSGAYLLAKCGTLEAKLAQADQLVLKSFTNLNGGQNCAAGRSMFGTGVVKSLLLNKCGPAYFPIPQQPSWAKKKDRVWYHRKLTLLTSTDTTKLRIREDRYAQDDARCLQAVVSTSTVEYSLSPTTTETAPTCRSDPLLSNSSYTFAALFSSASGQTMANTRPLFWMLYP